MTVAVFFFRVKHRSTIWKEVRVKLVSRNPEIIIFLINTEIYDRNKKERGWLTLYCLEWLAFFFLHSITLESNVKVLRIKTKTFATWSAVSAPLEISRECILMLGVKDKDKEDWIELLNLKSRLKERRPFCNWLGDVDPLRDIITTN